MALSSWRSGGGHGHRESSKGRCESVFATLACREVAGYSIRPSARALHDALTARLQPMSWVCGSSSRPSVGSTRSTGVCLAGCPGLLVAGGAGGLLVLRPAADADAPGGVRTSSFSADGRAVPARPDGGGEEEGGAYPRRADFGGIAASACRTYDVVGEADLAMVSCVSVAVERGAGAWRASK